MDTVYIEPFGLIMGGALTVLQLLDHCDISPMPWNTQTKKKGGNDVGTQVAGFFKNNSSAIMGFASGYVVGYNIVDWTSNLSLDLSDDLAERTEETAAKRG